MFLLIEQLLITDGTVAPLNRLRTIYTFAAAIALFVFGIGAAFVANRWYDSSSPDAYQHSKWQSRTNIIEICLSLRRCYCFCYCIRWNDSLFC